MKLTLDTIEILNNFASVCNNLQFKAGDVVKTKSTRGTIRAEAKLNQSFPRDFAIYDLNRFISVLSLYKEPELDFKNDYVEIKEDNRTLRYVYTDSKMIVSVDYSKGANLPPELTKFTLTAEHLSRALKAAKLLNLPNLVIQGETGKVSLIVTDIKNATSDNYDIEVCDTTENFKLTFQRDVLVMLPEDYEVTIYGGPITKLSSAKVTYYLAALVN